MSRLPFADSDDQERPPQAARLAPKLRELAGQGIYLGGSSWKYPGWLGSIYAPDRYVTRGKHSKAKFEESCLAEYAQTFSTVCGDFAFYQFPPDATWKKLFDQLPAGFQLALKCPDRITVASWPKHARYGPKAGGPNDEFLDARSFRDRLLSPLGFYADRLGPIVFEFGTFAKSTFAKPEDFYRALDPFLAALPDGFRYAVEIRNPEYLTPPYLDLLGSHNVAHILNAWIRMPELGDQAQLPATADFTVVRALLKRGRSYEDAVKTFEPYEKVQEPNESARDAMITVAERSMAQRLRAYIFVNNRLEGNAPSTIEAVADRLI